MRVYVDSVGCEQREIDAQRVIDYLRANRMEIASSPKSCDYAVVVTCAVDGARTKASVSRLESVAQQMPEDARLVVGGCLPSINPKKLESYKVYATFSPRNLEVLDSIFGGKIADIPVPNRSVFDDKTCQVEEASPRREYDFAKDGFKIVIDDGCLLSCSYCAIKKATGRLRSAPLNTIVSQFEKGIAQEEPTIMLMGGDTGAYGRDIGLRFYNLLGELNKHSGDSRLFIHDFNVNWLIEDLESYEESFKSDGRFRGVTFPVQSGSDRILNLMRRPYTHKDASQAIRTIKNRSSNLRVGTHVIVGFPTESEDDFQSTLGLLDEVGFDFISCFPYAECNNTCSAKISEKVSQEVVTDRIRRLSTKFGERVRSFGV